MKAKVDKDFLVKNLFWILLSTAGVLLCIKFIIVLIPSDAGKAEKEFKDSKVKLETAYSERNGRIINYKNFSPPWDKRQGDYRIEKNKVWGQAWLAQNMVKGKNKEGNDEKWEHPILTWPQFANGNIRPDLTDNRYFGDKLTADLCVEYRNNYNTQLYVDKVRPSMKKFLYPNEAPVDFRFPVDGDPERIFRPVKWNFNENPTPEECWLAQEELCVRREMVLILKEAYDSIAKCEQVTDFTKEKNKLPAKAVRYRNRTWELDLVIDNKSVTKASTIRNVNPSGRPQSLVNEGLGTFFRLRQNGKSVDLKEIRGGKGDVLLQPNQKEPAFEVDQSFASLSLSEPFTVEQVFDEVTSPLKRIEALEVGSTAMSHRIAPIKLVKGPATPEEPQPEDSGTMGDSGMGMATTGGGMGMPAVNPNDVTPQNALIRRRYAQVNEQVRRLPVAFSVQIDQAYIPDVLAAVANSRLRIQTMQFHWQHTPPVDTSGGVSPYPMGGMGGIGMPPMRQSWNDAPRPMRVPPMGGGPGPGGPGETTAPNASDADTVQRNLVELSVYGIASLYNKYPAKKPATSSGQ